jgi:hypothetical protein
MPNNREFIKVIVRCRPHISSDENTLAKCFAVNEDSNSVLVDTAGKKLNFSYDRVFGESSTQKDLFDSVKPIIDSALMGLNGTVFAYGTVKMLLNNNLYSTFFFFVLPCRTNILWKDAYHDGRCRHSRYFASLWTNSTGAVLIHVCLGV